MKKKITRRSVLKTVGAGVLATIGAPRGARAEEAAAPKSKGNIHQSICRWCYNGMSLDDLCVAAKKHGYVSIELLGPDDVLKVKKYGLTCAMLSGLSTMWDPLESTCRHASLSIL